MLIGKYPDESYVGNLIAHREINQLTRAYGGVIGLYLIAIIILFILGFIYQTQSESPDNNKSSQNNIPASNK